MNKSSNQHLIYQQLIKKNIMVCLHLLQVFQRRLDDSVIFNLPWTEYVNGFGDPRGNFWLGLENIYILTTSGNYKLLVEVYKPDGTTIGYACYNTFAIGDENAEYALVTAHGFIRGSPNGRY